MRTLFLRSLVLVSCDNSHRLPMMNLYTSISLVSSRDDSSENKLRLSAIGRVNLEIKFQDELPYKLEAPLYRAIVKMQHKQLNEENNFLFSF